MQRVMGQARRAIQEYGMIAPGDHVAAAVSGGKDSLAMLAALARLRRILPGGFTLTALSLEMGFPGGAADWEPVRGLCNALEVPFELRKTQIGEIVFSARQEKNPCSLCSRMRRGALLNAAQALGLGHHRDDAVETFLMNLTREGRLDCFSPVTVLEDRGITLIRPLCLVSEREIGRAVRGSGLTAVKSRCPDDHATARQERKGPGTKGGIFGALRRSRLCGW
mgnify:CR=1 FL=1